MQISSKKYPLDIIICILWSITLIPLIVLEIDNLIRIFIGLPFILFIPGYVLIFALFPNKISIDIIERIALSFGLSLAIVPLIGLGLNYTPWGIRLQPIYFSIFTFIIIFGVIGFYRWIKTESDNRFLISINLSLPKSENKLDKALTIILIGLIIIAFISLIYVIMIPKTGERFTEFYLLGSGGKAENYPSNLTIGERANLTIGIANHEYQIINYTIEIWLVNQTTSLNSSINENITTYHNMWFMKKINVILNHTTIDIERPWKPQWEYNYVFNITHSGTLKLAFLLYKEPTEDYISLGDYRSLAKQKIDSNNSTAYRSLHLWINVQP